jgi:hypothetical protein
MKKMRSSKLEIQKEKKERKGKKILCKDLKNLEIAKFKV